MTSRPATEEADEAPRRTREKTSGSQGSAEEALNKEIMYIRLDLKPVTRKEKSIEL